MEAKACSQRWKMYLPDLKHSKRGSSPTAKDGERGKREQEGRAGPHKTVTLTATSRYLTDRQYVARKPLSSTEHTSILKKTHSQKLTETVRRTAKEGLLQEEPVGVSRREHTGTRYSARPREELTPEGFSLSHSDISCPSASREDLSSPLGVSELQAQRCHKLPTCGSPSPTSRSGRMSLSSAILEVQRLNPPLRPRLTSTVLYPTYTPRSGYTGQTQLRLRGKEGRGGGETKQCSLGRHSIGDTESPYQANYWACAIPKALPPSPDRQSSGWDPNKEYQALLDYTYPLRSGQVVSEWDSSEVQADSLLQTNSNLQDSGIELDQLYSSTSLSGLDFSTSGAGQTREKDYFCAGHSSPDLERFPRSPDGPPSSTLVSLTDPMALSFDSLDSSKDRGGTNRCKSNGHHHQHHAMSSSTSSAFIRSISVLPQSRCMCGEVDDEFRPLPEQLVELQLLSRQVREVIAQLGQPVTASWESLRPGTTSILSSVTLPEKQGAEDEEEEETQVHDPEDEQDKDEVNHRSREQRSAAQKAADHRYSETARSSFGAWMESAGEGLSQSSLREVEALVERLCGLNLPESQRNSNETKEQSDCLMQHIQVFCSHLDLLIQQLYAVSEKMELLAAPTVDIDSVKSSLAEYQSFQREVSSHQPLTSSVLHTGQLLLSCINTTSPLLRDTLLLIERQSGTLQSQTERFFSSILSAMNSLTQPSQHSPVQQSREEDAVEVHGFTL